MGTETEPAKALLPYLQRADELQKHEPLVSYYCRLYAMEKGLGIPNKDRTKMTNSILISLMNQLEKDKKSIKLGPDDSLYVEGFASSVFAKADKQDRAGRADINTAKTFYAARIFFETLNQFGELQPDIQQKLKYAEWKAADISKAIKEGRKPEPGPPGGDEDLSFSSNAGSGSRDLQRNESLPINHRATGADTSPDFDDEDDDNINYQPPTNRTVSLPIHPPPDHPSDDFHSVSSPTNRPDNASRSPNMYHQQQFPHETQQPPVPQNYSSHVTPQNYAREIPQDYAREIPQDYARETLPNYPFRDAPQDYPPHGTPQHFLPYETPQNYPFNEVPFPPSSLPNFQSYPSFTDHSLPSAPTHQPSYQLGLDTSYSHQIPPAVQSYPSAGQHASSSRNNGAYTEPAKVVAKKFEYDSNYMPPPENIADAHKAARFAVGALAFDDVSTAVDHLITALEFLTNPSAKHK